MREDFSKSIERPSDRPFYLKIAPYGLTGSGKTTLAATAMAHPDMSPILFASIDGGMLAVRGAKNDKFLQSMGITEEPHTIYFGDPDKEEIDGEESENVIQRLDEFYQWLRYDKPAYKTLVIDNITMYEQYSLINLVNSTGAYTDKRSAPKGKDPERYIDVRDYRKNNDLMWDRILNFKRLKMHLVLISQLKEFTTGWPDNVRTYAKGPAVSPSLADNISQFFDITGHLELLEERVEIPGQDPKLKKEDRKTTLNTFTRFTSRKYGMFQWNKDRSAGSKVGRILDDPTLPEIYNKVISEDQANKESNSNG